MLFGLVPIVVLLADRSAALVTSWKISRVNINLAVAGAGDLATCQKACALNESSQLKSLTSVDKQALICANSPEFIKQNCTIEVSVEAESRTDTDAIICASSWGTSFSESVLDDCAYSLTHVKWNAATVTPVSFMKTFSNMKLTMFGKEFKEGLKKDTICADPYWTDANTTVEVTASGVRTEPATTMSIDINAEGKGLSAGHQWWIPASKNPFVISSTDTKGQVSLAYFVVAKKYKAGDTTLCKGYSGASSFLSVTAFAQFIFLITLLQGVLH